MHQVSSTTSAPFHSPISLYASSLDVKKNNNLFCAPHKHACKYRSRPDARRPCATDEKGERRPSLKPCQLLRVLFSPMRTAVLCPTVAPFLFWVVSVFTLATRGIPSTSDCRTALFAILTALSIFSGPPLSVIAAPLEPSVLYVTTQVDSIFCQRNPESAGSPSDKPLCGSALSDRRSICQVR